MPLDNKNKIISIIYDQCDEIEERYDGYRTMIIEVIADILMYEREHRVSATNIQKKINDKCNALARRLSTQRDKDIGTEILNS